MIHLGKKTKKDPVDVLDAAVAYFGPQGLGLDVRRRASGGVYFVGAGGHVQVSVSESDDGKTDVDIQSREWDYQAEQFLGKI